MRNLPAEYTLTRVLITVMTYPHPSVKSEEAVCTAGLLEDGSWVRLYPVNYRAGEFCQKFHKFQWIEVGLAERGGRNDMRPESRKPFVPSLRLLGEPIAPGKEWRERREWVDKLKHSTVLELKQQYELDKTSLGVVRPKKVLDVVVEEADREWKPEWESIYNQQLLFGDAPKRLEKLPFKWSYVFECEDSSSPHKAMIEDWELGVLFLKERERVGEEQAAHSVRDKYLNTLCGKKRDTRFFMGTTWPNNSWVVIGVFWPPRIPQLDFDF